MLSIAVLGCGRIGSMHAANIATHKRARLAGVYDANPQAAHTVAEPLGVPVLASAEAAMQATEAVLIASPTETHADYIEMAVAHGKPVLCEKPIDLSLPRVMACAQTLQTMDGGKDAMIQMGFNRRFDPGHRAAQAAHRAGEIGDLHQIIITSRDPGLPPRAYLEQAGGLFRDMTIHDFDLARFFLEDEPIEVFAFAQALVDPQLGRELDEVDTAMIVMRTASGVQCHINNSRASVYGYDQRVELLGSRGMVVSGNRKPHEVQKFTKDSVGISEPYLNFFIERYTEAFAAEIDAFVTAVESGTPPEVGFDDGCKALVLAEAALCSLRERRVIRVSDILG